MTSSSSIVSPATIGDAAWSQLVAAPLLMSSPQPPMPVLKRSKGPRGQLPGGESPVGAQTSKKASLAETGLPSESKAMFVSAGTHRFDGADAHDGNPLVRSARK